MTPMLLIWRFYRRCAAPSEGSSGAVIALCVRSSVGPVIILTGAGVEDSRTPIWGHVYRSLVASGRETFVFDPIEAVDSGRKGTPRDQWIWLLDELQPEKVVMVPSTPQVDEMLASELDSRGISSVVLDDEPHVNTDLFRPVDVSEIFDIALIGDANPKVFKQLRDAGLSVTAYGEGWHDDLAHTHGPIPYTQLAEIYCSARVAVVASEQCALEAMACHRPFVRITDDFDVSSLQSATVKPVQNSWREVWDELLGAASQVKVTKDGPKVTVFTGLYNVERFVGQAIESVLAQTVDDFEFLIVNDGSPDGSRAIAERYVSDPRIKLLDHHANIGQTGRFDLIWRSVQRHAHGEFITALGADDRMPPDRLARQLEVFENEPAVDIAHGGCWELTDSDVRKGPYGRNFSYDSVDFGRYLFSTNFVMVPTFMMRLQFQRDIGEWARGFAADYHLWLKSFTRARFRYMPVGLVDYRVHEGSASTSTEGAVRNISETEPLVDSERSRRTLNDLYPQLDWAQSTTPRDWAAAHVDLAIRYADFSGSFGLAFEEYEAALSLVPEMGSQIATNIAYTHLLAGDLAAATLAAKRAGLSIEDMQTRGFQLITGPQISMLPFEVPRERLGEVFWWDGTPKSLRRLLCIVDWNAPQLAAPVVEFYLREYGGVPNVELVFITNGMSEPDAMNGVMSILPGDIDLENAPALTLERCDHLGFLPAERYSLILDCRPGSTLLERPGQALAQLSELSSALRSRQ